jgi:hypothetical protein
MLYTLLLGWAVLSGMVPFLSAYLLMAFPCVAPIAWYSYGFLRVNETEQDFGLLASALGWGLIAIALLVKHVALNTQWRAFQSGAPGMDPARLGQSMPATICTVLGVALIALGAALAFHAWTRESRRNRYL